MKSLFKITYLALFLIVFTSSCKKDVATQPATPEIVNPGLLSFELIDTLRSDEINEFLDKDLNTFLPDTSNPASKYLPRMARPKNDIALFKIRYQSFIPEQGNRPTVATGLIAIPVSENKTFPVISYQHGTIFEKDQAPSNPRKSDETKFMLAQFAAQGYVVISADYFGLGDVSNEHNSYFVRYSTEQACLDMYKASMQFMEKHNLSSSKFFINGWSQGGYNTMLFLRRLEKENIQVDAAFTAAGPADPLLAITRGIFNPRPFDAFWVTGVISNMLFSLEKYNNFEGLAKQYIRPEYFDVASKFYNFSITDGEFFSKVPPKIDSMFTQKLIDDAKTTKGLYWQTLSSSEAYKWYSKTPLRAYYGERDEVISVDAAKVAVEYMKVLGKQDATLHNAGATANHRATYIESIADAKAWIDSFK